jgi:hypothetical protein
LSRRSSLLEGETDVARSAPVWLRVIGGIAILWNGIGVLSYLHHVGLVPGPQPVPEGMPPLVTAAYAIGVFGAIGGSLGLLLARRWAIPLLWLSLIGLLIDWGWIFANAPGGSVALGVTVLAVALALALVASLAARRGWLR